MGPRTSLDAVEERNISFPCRESNPARSPSLYTGHYGEEKNLLLLLGIEPDSSVVQLIV
jgi:hypothetical protein